MPVVANAESLLSSLAPAAPAVRSPTDERILDAAVEELRLGGLRRLTIEAVALRAGVSRVTVHRRFDTRDRLANVALGRETQRFLATVAAADRPEASNVDRIAGNFAAAVSAARSHSLIEHWLDHDPGELLRQILADGASALDAGRDFLSAQIREHAGLDEGWSEADIDRATEVLVRLFIGLVLMPPASMEGEDQTVEFAREAIAPVVLGLLGGHETTANGGRTR